MSTASRANSAPADARLVHSKFVPAPVPASAVLRHPLLRRLDAAVLKKATLVAAPPGSGKSVLLGQWTALHAARRVAWLTLDGADDDANRFARHLCAALAFDASPGGTVLGAPIYGGQHMGATFVAALVRHSARIPPTVLVLDDVHLLTSPALLGELTSFVELAAPGLRFVLLGRTDPPLALHRLRLDDDVAEIRQQDLAFACDDAAELIRRVAHRNLDDAQIDLLVETTEGWIAGLHLAALSLRHAPDVDEFLASFAGDERQVGEYLTEQVLRNLPAPIERFLVRTSVLDRMTAPLCDALTGDSDAQQILEYLDQRSLFTTRLDNHRGWYRYHPMFRSLLRGRLGATDPHLLQSLLLTAAEWYLARDDEEAAVPYLVSASAWSRVVDVASKHGETMYREGRIGALVRWLDLLPPSERSAEPAVLGHAFAHTMAGNTTVAEELLRSNDGVTSATGTIVADVIRTCWVQHHLPTSAVRLAARRALDGLDTAPPFVHPGLFGVGTPDALRRLALLNRGLAEMYDGDGRAAIRTLAAMAAAPGSGHVTWDVTASGALALVAAWSGELQRAGEHGARALDIAREGSLVDHSCTTHAYLALAHVACERDDLHAAEGLLQEAAARAHQVRASALVAIHAAEAAQLALACGNPDDALLVLMRHRAEKGVPPVAVAERLRIAEARVLLAVGDLGRARSVLELRDHPFTPALAACAVRVAVQRDDLEEAASLLARWPTRDAGTRDRVARLLWQAVLLDAEDDEAGGRVMMALAVALAEPEGFVRLFLDGGYHVVSLVRAINRTAPTRYLRSIVDRRGVATRPMSVARGVEALSDREAMVLGFLPSHLSNAAIAGQLCISTNTLKTHLKHIYRKLGVDGRRAAVDTAERLQLL